MDIPNKEFPNDLIEYREYHSRMNSPSGQEYTNAFTILTERVTIPVKGGDEMANEDWMRSMVEKMDNDQKEAEKRHREDIQKFHEEMRESEKRHQETFAEIKAIMNRMEDKIEAGNKENQSILRQTMWWTIGTVIAIVAMAITMLIGLIQIAQAIV